MAEGRGLEPRWAFARQFSRLLPYQLGLALREDYTNPEGEIPEGRSGAPRVMIAQFHDSMQRGAPDIRGAIGKSGARRTMMFVNSDLCDAPCS